MSNEKRAPGYLLYIVDEKLPSYMGIIMNHYKDPYQSTSIMESKRVFFVAQMVYRFFGALRISWDPDQWKGLLEPEFRRGVLVLKIAACVLRGGVRILRVGYFF